jgi:lysophospholipase L1-like esterase
MSDPSIRRPIDRRSVLRLGGAAAATAGVAALIPAQPAEAASPPATTTLAEAFGGVTVPPRALERWLCSHDSRVDVVCIGDSITQGYIGGFEYTVGGSGSWVDKLGSAMGRAIGPNLGYGFRGLWLGLDSNSDHEWTKTGTWKRTTASQAFDVCPFGDGFYSNGGSGDILTWTKPSALSVSGFDLYWFGMSGAGNWQYRVDNGAWTNMNQSLTSPVNKLHKFYVSRPVNSTVQIRAYNGTAACLAPIGGIGIYSTSPLMTSGVVVHDLGRDSNFLAVFARSSAGDPLAWFDAVVSNPPGLKVRPALVTVMFSNDVVFNSPARWQSDLLTVINRIAPYADVLLMNPYEQNVRDPTVQANYRAATQSIATANRCGLLDLYDAWASAGDTGWSEANASGLMNDDYHPSRLGHADVAGRAWRLLRTFS